MNITTKLSPGQTSWSVFEGEIIEAPVKDVYTRTNLAGETKITYNLGVSSQSPATYDRPESEVFASIDDLMKSERW
jgi:hypothetical protein